MEGVVTHDFRFRLEEPTKKRKSTGDSRKSTALNRFYGKTCLWSLKSWIFISIYAIKVLLLHTKSSLKVTQCAEE